MVIFATTGTHGQSMDRLVRWLDEWAAETGEEVRVQVMTTSGHPQHATVVTCLDPSAWRAAVLEARVVVTHAGPASIAEVCTLGVTPVVVPRRVDCSEHVDDHQQRYAATLDETIPVVHTRDGLWRCLASPPDAPHVVSDGGDRVAAVGRAADVLMEVAQSASRHRLGRLLRWCFWRSEDEWPELRPDA